ncbi:MAG: hypothetical protein V3569_01670 [Acholeplasmataceae bacterium]
MFQYKSIPGASKPEHIMNNAMATNIPLLSIEQMEKIITSMT